ncbi:MAG: TlyA family RNA methyltransferase [Rickettsiales bacterium]
MAPKKTRLDARLCDDGLAGDLREAVGLILRGDVLVNGTPVASTGAQVKTTDAVALKSGAIACPWASRGGFKLDFAVRAFGLNLKDMVAMDVGASTGGFTDVLLHYGVGRVYAVDVGYGELAWKVRSDPRVVPVERTNARHLTPERVNNSAFDIIVCDVSFISLTLALPPAIAMLRQGGLLVALIKPQFEADREASNAGGGVIRDVSVHKKTCLEICDWAVSQALTPLAMCRSPVAGRKGNAEFLLLAVKK